MSNLKDKAAASDNWFKRGDVAPIIGNRRKSIRYVRNDIGATVKKIGIFNFTLRVNRDISAKLIDISSRGVLISTNMRLAINEKISLTIRFADFKEFNFPCKVIRKAVGDRQFYGIKFDSINEEVAEYILATQRKLKFK